jgi:hypothetical protein
LAQYSGLRDDQRYAVRSNLAMLSLMSAHPEMPDPQPHRGIIASLLQRLERAEGKPA